MGAKDSKPCFISYDDAVKRVSDSEFRRIRDEFKRCAGANSTSLTIDAFVHEVLCDGVPYEVAEWLFQACGGTKRGITFKDLLCGVVVLTKGSIEEKIKFLWTLYVNNQYDNGPFIYKWDFARALHFENTSLPVTGAPRTLEVLTSLFGVSDKVSFEQFRSWLLIHKDATVLSNWLLANTANICQELETPTFYQSLAGVTHLEEKDIIELEKCFWTLCKNAPTGELDAASLTPLLSPPLPKAAVTGTFLAFDENRDGHIDFKELCCGLSAACRGPRIERLKFCFKIFDTDRDGVLNKYELIHMVTILSTVANEAIKFQESRSSTPTDINDTYVPEKRTDPEVILKNLRDKLITVSPKNGIKPVFQLGPTSEREEILVTKKPDPPYIEDIDSENLISKDMALTLEDFLIWSVESDEALISPFLDLIFEVCHIVLGLRPQCKHQERNIVLGWLRRETQRGYTVGQFWYLVAADWWSSWLAYTTSSSDCCRPHVRHIDEAIVCDESFTSNSTESMGSLLWRADVGAEACAESASLGSSSSGVSSMQRPPRHPGHIDNRKLIQPDHLKVRTLTGEGGHLRRDVTLAQHRDFELIPDALWEALAHWYGGPEPLPRQVIRPTNSEVELELYPIQLKLYRHIANTPRMSMASATGGVPMYSGVPLAPSPPDKQLAYTAAFSRLATVRQVSEFLCQALCLAREDMRLWCLGNNPVLFDDERPTLQQLKINERSRILIELRNKDLTWPEEIGALSLSTSGNRASERRETLSGSELAGATGLHNLGNTCYMNAALHAVWNTGPLTRYFNSGMHLYEVNTTNTLGTKGVLALRYGELCKEVWSSSARSVAPLRVRVCVSRHARALAGGGQHDAQELLAWLLDNLHEDLNRSQPLQGIPPAISDGKEDNNKPDEVLAAESWQQHILRNKSIMTDLFYGQLKSKVCCDTCGRGSTRLEVYNMLSLPLPIEACHPVHIRVVLQDGSVPVKYGVLVNSEGTYSDLKKKLSELCGLEPELLLLVEVLGATITCTLPDDTKVSCMLLGELVAYETPTLLDEDCVEAGDSSMNYQDCATPEPKRTEVSGAAPSSLCMPALFCFKRSRSEIVMSQSPPNTFFPESTNQYSVQTEEYRCNTLPKDLTELKRKDNSSPTLSVKSLNFNSSSPRLGKVKFGSSPSNMNRMNEIRDCHPPTGKIRYLVAVHRKQTRMDSFFLPASRVRPQLFGSPLLVRVRDGMSGRDLYARVWAQVARLLSARPPSYDRANHATDCDDSLGYEFPFTLRAVSGRGDWCGVCPWGAFCRGCALPTGTTPLITGCMPNGKFECDRKQSCVSRVSEGVAPDPSSPIAKAKFNRQCSGRTNIDIDGVSQEETLRGELQHLDLRGSLCGCRRGAASLLLAIDWDPTAFHLRYHSAREKAFITHPSVAQCLSEAHRPIDLASCMSAFTSQERLEQPYHCDQCRSKQPATKKLQIWRLPPILIIHLKRFQYVNNKWIKSQKVVNFPFQDFDPTDYLASLPQETILRHKELKSTIKRTSLFVDVSDTISESDSDDDDEQAKPNTTTSKVKVKTNRIDRRNKEEVKTRKRIESTSLEATPVQDDNLVDYHMHHLKSDQDPLSPKYRLYAVVSHSGQMSGGHYVAFARHPSGTWLCYNDSSCRELTPVKRDEDSPPVPPIDPSSAYLLFYERQGLDYEAYLPDITGKEPVIKESDLDMDDNDLRKMCVIT